ncbi:MAG: glycoside hydrolase family 3 C-terminal domain-containing protein, partial [Firmicutes bacterium]|nr:glycoside hydrolase family 3 C-terminal domain-containing protein [Bacillota bacterium]
DDGYMGAEMVGDLNAMEHNVYDAIIVFIGDNYGAETETEFWDRDSIRFANYMNGIVRAATKACDNVIVVMQTGSAAIPVRWEKDAKGILQMWYSGEGGGKAVADILFGKINPSGKLSETFVLKERTDVDRIGDGLKTWYREGMFVGYRYYDRHPEDIWFPFGHGLSYTQFKYSDIVLKRCEGGAEVSCKIRNIGTVGGKEVVQLYVAHKNSVVMRPDKELKAFDKIYLNPGEEKTVSFKLDMRAFAYYNVCLRKWYTENGTYNILIGASSRDIRLTAEYVHNDKKGYSVDSELSVMTML